MKHTQPHLALYGSFLAESEGERSATRLMMKDQRHAFAIVRVEDPSEPIPFAKIDTRVTIKEIVATQALAEAEVDRLSKLNEAKGCAYFWQMTRLVGELAQESKQD